MAPPTHVKLTYFNGRGRAETCRWVMLAAGQKFEDYRLKDGEWPKVKEYSPNAQTPFAEIDGKCLASSHAIAAYIAKQYGMYGADDWEAAEIQMCVDLVEDTLVSYIKFMFCKDENEKAKLLAAYTDVAQPRLFAFVERRLKKAGCNHLVANKLSLADIAVVQFLYDTKENREKLDSSPVISEYVNKITDIPSIANWIQSRPETSF